MDAYTGTALTAIAIILAVALGAGMVALLQRQTTPRVSVRERDVPRTDPAPATPQAGSGNGSAQSASQIRRQLLMDRLGRARDRAEDAGFRLAVVQVEEQAARDESLANELERQLYGTNAAAVNNGTVFVNPNAM